MKLTITCALTFASFGISFAAAVPIDGAQLNVTRDPDFPSGDTPPGHTFWYEIKYHFPPVALMFHSWNIVEQRNEAAAEEAITKATRDAIDPAKKYEDIDDPQLWTAAWPQGKVHIGITPAFSRGMLPPGFGPLSWGIWSVALIGVNGFRMAYPHLDVNFEVHINIEDHGGQKVANGGLFTDITGNDMVNSAATTNTFA